MRHLILLLALISISLYATAQPTKTFGFGFTLTAENQIKIDTIYTNSPAAKALLKKNDIIISYNGQALTGKTLQEAAATFRSADEGSMIYSRAGKQTTLNISKAYSYTFDRKCLSGDCINGFGKAKMYFKNNFMFEGTFTDGIINGDVKVYKANGCLYYVGGMKEGKCEGQGKFVFQQKYTDKASNQIKFTDPITEEEGTYVNNLLAEGARYNAMGGISEKGTFKNGELISGVYSTSYRGYVAYTQCSDIITKRRSDGVVDREHAGSVTIHMETPDGKILSEGYYDKLDRRRNGAFKEYDYDGDVKHIVNYRGGGLSDFNNEIYSISTGNKIAYNVIYNKDVQEYFSYNIEVGTFKFGSQVFNCGSIGERISVSQARKIYDEKAANPGSISSSYSGNAGTQSTQEDLLKTIDKYYDELDQVTALGKEFLRTYNGSQTAALEKLTIKAEILGDDVTDFLTEYRGSLSRELIEELEELITVCREYQHLNYNDDGYYDYEDD